VLIRSRYSHCSVGGEMSCRGGEEETMEVSKSDSQQVELSTIQFFLLSLSPFRDDKDRR
jgi:hypothetical protein